MTVAPADGSGIARQAGLPVGASPFNVRQFEIAQALSQVCTMKLVKIMAVQNAGELATTGYVDVLPLVSMQDGLGNITPHETIFNVPYLRMQGGKNAIILDPVVGDIGFVVVSDRDISAVKETKKQSPPGSRRTMDLADSVYIGGILNEVPEQYIQFNADGVKIVDKNGNKIESGPLGWTITGDVMMKNNLQLAGLVYSLTGGVYSGSFTTSGTITGGKVIAGAIDLQAHHHTAQGAFAATTVSQP